MRRMVKVSVIVPVYNGEKYIREAIDSILNQSYKDFEVIVIDDGSKDNTLSIIKEYAGKIRWKSQKNKGQASAINEGIKMAKGEYVAYLDADDVCMPQRLEIQVKYLDEHPDVGLVYSSFCQVNSIGKIQRIIKAVPYDHFVLLQKDYIARSAVMHRKKCLDKVGLFDEGITGDDDWDMWIRISEKFGIGHVERPLVKYRVHGEQISLVRSKKLAYRRYTTMRIVEKACARRKNSFWLKIKLLRAKVERKIGETFPILDKNFFARIWRGADIVLDWVERTLIRISMRL
jgi:glycosyltransferase involved in cell wall biosynthesis